MKYGLLKDVLNLLEDFEIERNSELYPNDLDGLKKWIVANYNHSDTVKNEPNWIGKESGRSADSVISTLLVHMNRYAKSYSKAAILDSEFSTQEDFIYLITLKSFGAMSKMDLIKKNVHDKPAGMLIINRLMSKGWLVQNDSIKDKRSKILEITAKGLEVLDNQMDKIRKASSMVTGNLTNNEKMDLIVLLNKLNDFHLEIYDKNIDVEQLLEEGLLRKD